MPPSHHRDLGGFCLIVISIWFCSYSKLENLQWPCFLSHQIHLENSSQGPLSTQSQNPEGMCFAVQATWPQLLVSQLLDQPSGQVRAKTQPMLCIPSQVPHASCICLKEEMPVSRAHEVAIWASSGPAPSSAYMLHLPLKPLLTLYPKCPFHPLFLTFHREYIFTSCPHPPWKCFGPG